MAKYFKGKYPMTAINGMNFSRSIHDTNSRLHRVLEYLRMNGPCTKRDILRDVFGFNDSELTPSKVRGWGSLLFSLGVHHGYFAKERRGRITYWSVG